VIREGMLDPMTPCARSGAARARNTATVDENVN
jgi:hypothetical protein